MKKVKGDDRIVYVFDNIVIKFPRIWFRFALRRARKWFWKGVLFEKFMCYDCYSHLSVQRYLLRGIVENWHEFIFYRKHKLKVLVPTYFSFLGLINIQKRVDVLKLEAGTLFAQLDKITNRMVWDDCHVFDKVANFTKGAGYLQVLDYGSLRSQRVLLKYSEAITEEFDFDFDKDEYQRKVLQK